MIISVGIYLKLNMLFRRDCSLQTHFNILTQVLSFTPNFRTHHHHHHHHHIHIAVKDVCQCWPVSASESICQFLHRFTYNLTTINKIKTDRHFINGKEVYYFHITTMNSIYPRTFCIPPFY
jgi:hypothetical protein